MGFRGGLKPSPVSGVFGLFCGRPRVTNRLGLEPRRSAAFEIERCALERVVLWEGIAMPTSEMPLVDKLWLGFGRRTSVKYAPSATDSFGPARLSKPPKPRLGALSAISRGRLTFVG